VEADHVAIRLLSLLACAATAPLIALTAPPAGSADAATRGDALDIVSGWDFQMIGRGFTTKYADGSAPGNP